MPKTRVTSQDVKDAGISTADLADDCVTADKLGILTAKGQVISHDGSGPVVVPAASSSLQVLTSDSGAASGLVFVGVAALFGSGDAISFQVVLPSGITTINTIRKGDGSVGLDSGTNGLFVGSWERIAGDKSSPANGDAWFNTTAQAIRHRVQGQTHTVAATLGAATGLSSSIANTTTETTVSNATQNLAAGHPRAERAYRLTAWGTYSTTGAPTIQFRVKAGGNLVQGGALTTVSGAAGRNWIVRATVFFVDGTSTATVRSVMESSVDNSAVNVRSGTQTINPTSAIALTLSAQWSAASASNTLQCEGAIWETLG